MAGYYDIVLGLIPVALLGITAALTVVGLSITTAVPIGAVVAIGLIGHAMFVNAPIDGRHAPADDRDEVQSRHGPVNAD